MKLNYHDLLLDAVLIIIIIAAQWLLCDVKKEIDSIERHNAAVYFLKLIIFTTKIDPKIHFAIPM